MKVNCCTGMSNSRCHITIVISKNFSTIETTDIQVVFTFIFWYGYLYGTTGQSFKLQTKIEIPIELPDQTVQSFFPCPQNIKFTAKISTKTTIVAMPPTALIGPSNQREDLF